MPTMTIPQRRSRNQRLGFTVPQQVLYRPLVKAAWLLFCERIGAQPKDELRRRTWYDTHLEVATGKTTTSLCNRTSDFEDAMGYFEALGESGIHWQMKRHDGALRRATFALRQFCQEHDVEDHYVAGIARQMFGVTDLARLNKATQITSILASLKLHLKRQPERLF